MNTPILYVSKTEYDYLVKENNLLRERIKDLTEINTLLKLVHKIQNPEKIIKAKTNYKNRHP